MSHPMIGARLGRIEDQALLTGAGRFVDDIALQGVLHAAFLRSAVPHARIVRIDTRAAAALPGVERIFLHRDFASLMRTTRLPITSPVDGMPDAVNQTVVADTELCFVGEAIAMVVARSRQIAEDAAELIEMELESLPAIADCRSSMAPGAPKVRLAAQSNIVRDYTVGYGDADAAFARAAQVLRRSLFQHRGCGVSMEGRAVLASYDAAADVLTVRSSTQQPHDLFYTLIEMISVDENQLRVITPDVGGGFGPKFIIYPEEIAVAVAARALRAPVKWLEDRREHFISAIQERDQHWEMEMAVDAEGRILGLRGTLLHDQGAFSPQGIYVSYNSATGVTGPYIVPTYQLRVVVAQTNKVPSLPVRGAGYPQAAFTMERMMDAAALELGLDRAEVRRRNLIPAEKIPYTKPLKNRAGAPIVYESADFPRCQQIGLEAIDYAGFPARQARARAEGRYIGLGMGHAVKGTGRGPFETATVRIGPSGRVSIYTGAVAMGQGIKTTLAQVCADRLGVRIADIEVIGGDTAYVSHGIGGFASRQAAVAGSAVHLASTEIRAKILRVASGLLEVPEQDLDITDSRVHIAGVPASGMTLADLARRLRGGPGYALPGGEKPGLEVATQFQIDAQAFANGFHVAEVEVDPGTGGVRILRYVAVQDSGRLINPMLVDGQMHGGIVHGMGNALFEHMQYDAGCQPLSTTLADYLIPTSTEVPAMELRYNETPTSLNPLGVKGVGESGTIPVAAALIAAVEDALAPFGVRIDQAPVSPVRLAEAVRAAGGQQRAA